ncbi:MAG TPA: DHA2 family efflux MFS transporter permease subunit [Gammaproteobacteria bacterium]|jgi:DHA2 family multidrug resistance protein|nr:DHA2 family efflux MFS transporter permease subunit [Gammaproteobacteria bacterium]
MAGKQPAITGFSLALLTLGVSLAVFMNILDTSIANVAIPTIAGDLAISPNQGTWVITSFTVSLAISLPLSGWMARRVGEVRLFIITTLLFSLLSLACGLAPGLASLVLLRVLQGAVAGPMIPLSQSLLLNNYPKEKHGTALSIWSMTAVVAPVAGPLLGGWITDNYSWPWVFYINVPIGLIAVWITWRLLRGRETERERRPIDRVGLGLLAVGVAALQIMLDKGNDLNWFSSSTVQYLAAISVVTLSFFVAWELTEQQPIVDLTLFRQRNFTVATIALSLGYLTYFANVVVFPLWLQTEMGYTATQAGIASAPIGVLAVVVAPFMGMLMKRFDLRLLVTLSFATFGAVSFWNAGFTTGVTLPELMLPRLIYGATMPLFFVPLMSMAFAGLPPQRVASASGLINFIRMLGAGFGASLGIALWDQREALHDARLSEVVTVGHGQFAALQSLGANTAQGLAELAGSIKQQAFMQATNDFSWLSGCVFVALVVLVWFARRNAPVAAAAADAGH